MVHLDWVFSLSLQEENLCFLIKLNALFTLYSGSHFSLFVLTCFHFLFTCFHFLFICFHFLFFWFHFLFTCFHFLFSWGFSARALSLILIVILPDPCAFLARVTGGCWMFVIWVFLFCKWSALFLSVVRPRNDYPLFGLLLKWELVL